MCVLIVQLSHKLSRSKSPFGNSNSTGNNLSLSQQILGQNLPEKVEKPHVFKLTTFKGLNWCELCANFLWGFTLQGKKCEDCGVIAHSKCILSLINSTGIV